MRYLIKRFRNSSFKAKLLFFYVIIIIVPIISAEYYLYNSIVVSVSEKSFSLVHQKLESEYEDITGKLGEIERIGYLVSTNSIMQKYFTTNYYDNVEIISVMNNSVMPLLSWFYSTKASSMGRLCFMTNNRTVPAGEYIISAESLPGNAWFDNMEAALKNHSLYWEGIHKQRDYEYSNGSEIKVYSLFYTINSMIPESKTYVEIEVKSGLLFKFDLSGSVNQTNATFAIDHNNNIISANIPGFYIEIMDNADFRDRLKTVGYDNAFEVEASGIPYYVVTKSVKNIDAVLVSIAPKSEILKSFVQARNLFIMISLAVILLFGVISAFLAGLLLRRLKLVVKAVRKIQNGDFDIHLDLHGKDEIDELADDINIMSNKINDLINKVYKSEIAYKEASIAILQAQINPHFLFNVLETIRMMAVAKGQNEISEELMSLGGILRYNISVNNDMVTLDVELENLKKYIKLQNLLLNGRLKADIDIEQNLSECKVPRFTFQPLIENCIIHGYKGKESTLHIRISIRKKDNDLYFEIKDNGIGIDQEKLNKIQNKLRLNDTNTEDLTTGHGVALSNINQRIRLKYGDEYGIEIISQENAGTTITGILRVSY